MEFIKTLQGTPIPTLLVIGGLIFLFLGLATLKKPIVISITSGGRKISGGIGLLLLLVGIGLYLFPQKPSSPGDSTVTPTLFNPLSTETFTEISLSATSNATIPPFPNIPLALTPNAPIKDPAVEQVQRRLLELGYTEVGAVDGFYGVQTASAIKDFQAINNLPVDGVVTETVWNLLFSIDAKPKSKP